MAKEQFNVYLPTEVVAMVTGLCTTKRGMINKSDLIETLVRKEWAAATTPPQKRIEPIKNGNKTIGWSGSYEGRAICQTDGAGSKDECSRQLDAWVREELSK